MSIKILFTGVNSGVAKISKFDKGLAGIARRQGYEVCQNIADSPDLLICIDYDPRYKKLLREAGDSGVPLVLVKQEPPVVIPSHRWANPSGLFDFVITRAKAEHTPIFPAHQHWDTGYLTRDVRLSKIVAISADKWSSVPGELYSLRRRVYSRDARLDVFGHGWTDTKWKRLQRVVKELLIPLKHGVMPTLANLPFAFDEPLSFKGIAGNKLEVLSSYHASLVIENDSSSLSEKLVDCILAGTIPVYVGPPTSPFGIPESLIIRSEADIESLTRALDLALETDSQEFRSRAWSWASQANSRENWSGESVGTSLLSHIVSQITNNST